MKAGSPTCEIAVGWAWRGCLPVGEGSAWNRHHGGPERLLGWLESQLGLSAPPPVWTTRVTEYAALLAEAGGASYRESLGVDRWSTAAHLLRRRDALRLAGWDGGSRDGLPPLVCDLAQAEAGGRRLQPGLAERLDAVVATLDAGQVLPRHRVVLAEETSQWPARWRGVLSRLDVVIGETPVPGAPSTTSLGVLQRALAAGQACHAEPDGSLRHVVAESRMAACEIVAGLLAAERDGLGDTVVLCEDDEVAILLDACLARRRLPTMGGMRWTGALPALQVLPLVLDLCWEPVDPETLLAFVALPVGPIPRPAGRELGAALAEQPGLGSAAWERAIAKLKSPEADPEGKLATRVRRWLKQPRFQRGTPLPAAVVEERCRLVAKWAGGYPERESEDAGDSLGLRALAAQAKALGVLAGSHGGAVGEAQLARLLDAVRGEGSASTPRPEAQGGPLLVKSLAHVTRPVARLVWLGLGTGEAPEVPWTLAELAALCSGGVDVDDGSRGLECLRASERHGLLRVSERLLAVGLPGDEEKRWHPLWQQAREALRREPGGLVLPVALRRIVRGEETEAVRPWRLDTEEVTVLPPQPARPLWTVPPELLVERERSSASSLEARLACPLKWVLHYQARLRPSSVAQLPSGFLLRGSFCHAVLAGVFGRPGPCPDVADATDEIERLFDERVGLDAAPLAQPGRLVERHRVREELRAATRQLVETLGRGGYGLVGAEVEVEGTIEGRPLSGKIDCLVVRPDGGEAVVDFKYGGRSKYPTLLAEGRALQLATYAAVRRQQSAGADVRVAYLLIADGTVHTPEGSPLHGATQAALVKDAPAIHATWLSFAAALAGADGWLRGEGPIPARPLQEPEAWSPGVELALGEGKEAPPVCRYCDYGVLCGEEELE